MNISHNQRHLKFESAYNIRDLGGYQTENGDKTQWRRFLRADGLHLLKKEECTRLVEYGVSTIIDLRSGMELKEAPNPFLYDQRVIYHNIALFDELNPMTLMTQKDALLALYLLALETRQAAFVDVFKKMQQAPSGTILFHCSAGKDRTGLISAILLLIAGVNDQTIIDDYVLTGKLIKPLTQYLLRDSGLHNIPNSDFERLLLCEEETMAQTLRIIKERYGNIFRWLLSIGLTSDDILDLKKRLLFS
ncbi:tyrosine-protein phosphatase [Bartonella tamiae]|uniref:Tyrosine specific protein phosphatases domain-containing protein n=1 Tax=Bartonella tamiae Th239 TaxID=1094558 RepID=J1K1T7_9HYPH|nr:tyrosine-protein phosphatase [Bartonella tamiae]EJF91035.1 hypothetical protein ME5_00367 [Bartonella tamiae Th239]EJF93300.1 hypothetical protein MEG_01514 [Bartonella tamiae Th307]